MKEEILKKLFDYVSSLEVIAREQIPDVVNQVLMKGIILNSAGIIFSILSFINLYIAIKLDKNLTSNMGYESYGTYLGISVVLCMIGIIMIICCGLNLLEIFFIPKAYLLEVLK